MAEPLRTIAWFHCFSGIAGDMALGALVDAGADLDAVLEIVRRLPVSGWSVHAEPTLRGGIAATHMVVDAHETTVIRTYAHITGLIEEARLPDRVRERAAAIFFAIATVEARLHRRSIEQVHFHEVGSLDAIVDVVGVAAALEVLGVDEVASSPVATGTGMIRAAHGLLPNPAPAVVELLAGAPTHGVDLPVELTTPTGAGILAALCRTWGPMPAMTITRSGFGAGTRDLDALPNMTQVVLGTAGGTATTGQPVVLLEANVDDATGETLAHALAMLLEAGAHDAWVTPIVMKKGRPAHTVHVLADPALAGQLAGVLRDETGTLGVRGTSLERWPSPRTFEEVEVHGLPVRVKVGAGRVKVEHDDAALAARRIGLPLREVVSLAEEAWRRGRGAGTVVELPTTPDDAG
ncbi:MAG: Pyridinium-3,5-bisthiocarboxylic acid mononucleotide nickel insertion protein [Acidimicrobiales bacterium]|nr:Pyridinium-3,5-bisthiocarboxylic acid mononucleotide nickel insertion protein [Acidimicrobiales bacterium]